MKNRIISLLLAVVMLFSCLSLNVFAADGTTAAASRAAGATETVKTNALYTHTDAQIRKAFIEEIPNTTKLIIAQRVASVQEADMILVLDGGRIAAAGNHEQLLQTSEIYREVFESQVKGGAE